MRPPVGWDPALAVVRCPIGPWEGTVWRVHGRARPDPTDAVGSLFASGRWNVGHEGAEPPPSGTWAALYTALDATVAWMELASHLPDQGGIAKLLDRRCSQLRLELARVVDLRDHGRLGLPDGFLLRDDAVGVCRALARAARDRMGADGLLVRSAAVRGTGGPGFGDNVVVFPDRCPPGAVVATGRSHEFNLEA